MIEDSPTYKDFCSAESGVIADMASCIISSIIQDLCHHTKVFISQQLPNVFYLFSSAIHMADVNYPIFEFKNNIRILISL